MLSECLLNEAVGEKTRLPSLLRSVKGTSVCLHNPDLAQLEAEVSSELSVLRAELSAGHLAPPSRVCRMESRMELAGWLSLSPLLGDECLMARLSDLHFLRLELSSWLLLHREVWP